MRLLPLTLTLSAFSAFIPQVALAQMNHHHGYHGHGMLHHAEPENTKEAAPTHSGNHQHHAHGMGPAGSTYDLRFLN